MGPWPGEAGALQHVIDCRADAQTAGQPLGSSRHPGVCGPARPSAAAPLTTGPLISMQAIGRPCRLAAAPRWLAPQPAVAAAAGRRRSPPCGSAPRPSTATLARHAALRQQLMLSTWFSTGHRRRVAAATPTPAAAATSAPPAQPHAALPKLPDDGEAVLAGDPTYRPPAPLPDPPTAGTLAQVRSATCLLPL